MEQVKQQYLDIEGNRKCAAVCVSTNNKREAYNAAIRAERIQRGELAEGSAYILDDGQVETREKQVNLSPGDRIVFLKNTDKLQVKNGTMAELMSIDKEGNARAVTDAGKEVEWNLHEFKSLDHAYAITVNKAQGMTVDYVIADQTTNEVNDRNKFYVVLSRAKYNATVYTDDKDKYRKQVSRWAEKSSYDDYERSKNIPYIENGSYQNKEERALADEAQTKLPGAELERRRMLPLELADGLLADIGELAVKHDTAIQPSISKQLQESVRMFDRLGVEKNKTVAEKELRESEKPVIAMKHVKRQLTISKNEHSAGHGLGR